MTYESRVLGIIVVSKAGYDQYSEDDQRILEIFAGYAAQAMVNAEAFGQVHRQQQELQPPAREPAPAARGQRAAARDAGPERRAGDDRGLAQGGGRLRLAHDLPRRPGGLGPAGRRLARRVRRGDPPARGTARRRHHRLGHPQRRGRPRQRRPPRPAGHQHPGHARRAGVDDRVPAARRAARSSARSTCRGWAATRSHFSQDEFELCQLFAAQASIALRNAEAHGAVVTRAEHDALTGLRNHGAFQRHARRAGRRRRRRSRC